MAVIRIHHQADEIFHLCLISVIELIKTGHFFYRHGSGSHLLALVLTTGKYQLQRTEHIEEGRIMPAVGLSWNSEAPRSR